MSIDEQLLIPEGPEGFDLTAFLPQVAQYGSLSLCFTPTGQ